jgi:hypothetical protein
MADRLGGSNEPKPFGNGDKELAEAERRYTACGEPRAEMKRRRGRGARYALWAAVAAGSMLAAIASLLALYRH